MCREPGGMLQVWSWDAQEKGRNRSRDSLRALTGPKMLRPFIYWGGQGGELAHPDCSSE